MNTEGKKGTTTVGVITDDGIILAADKRASMGYLIADKNAKKVHFIDDKTVMTFAGSVADSQMLLRYLKKEISMYNIERGKKPGVNAIVTLLSHYIFSNAHSYMPYLVQFVVGGVDSKGFHLYSLDMSGSKMESKKFTATGSGSPIAYGVLEDNYKTDLELETGKKLAIRAINAAIERDLATGNGIDVVVIGEDGGKRLEPEEIEKILKE